MFDLHVSAEVSLQVELAGAVRALEWLAAGVEVHVSQQVVHSVEGLSAHLRGKGTASVTGRVASAMECRVFSPYLAFKRLDRQVHDHVRFQRLLLDKSLEADVALEGPHAGVDQHVSLQVGGQGELSGADVAFEFFHTLTGGKRVF